MAQKADLVVAHNGNRFDKPMFDEFCNRAEMSNPFNEISWLDTMTDINYPESCRARNLLYLAAYHGFINPFAHRAVFDVVTMLKILSFYDINECVDIMNSPTVYLVALVSFNRKDEAKAQGYGWQPNINFTWNDGKAGFWVKKVKACNVTDEMLEESFEVKLEESFLGTWRD